MIGCIVTGIVVGSAVVIVALMQVPDEMDREMREDQ